MQRVLEFSDKAFMVWCLCISFATIYIAMGLTFVLTLGSPHGIASFKYMLGAADDQDGG